MSNVVRFENIKQIVKMVEPQFNQLAKIHKAVDYEREASFALEALTNSDYLAQVAMGNQDSLKRAIINVAAVGLSLSPILKLAYLVPRKGKVCLDISYRGFVQLATDAGAIKGAQAELVCEKDEYTYQGMGREPIHKFNPFKDRGPIVGAYCIAKTHLNDLILTQMPWAEIKAIRDRSESFAAGKGSPWKSDESEMVKKTVIRRAYKSWPLTDTRDRLEQAIDVSSEADPIDLSAPPPQEETIRTKNIEVIRNLLVALKRSEEDYIPYLSRIVRRDVKKLDDLTEQEMDEAVIMLNGWLDMSRVKEKINEDVN